MRILAPEKVGDDLENGQTPKRCPIDAIESGDWCVFIYKKNMKKSRTFGHPCLIPRSGYAAVSAVLWQACFERLSKLPVPPRKSVESTQKG